eukprot:15216541-Alexandrium_andersonii.AAC.1
MRLSHPELIARQGCYEACVGAGDRGLSERSCGPTPEWVGSMRGSWLRQRDLAEHGLLSCREFRWMDWIV